MPPPPSILLISIDTLRADHLGVYGYPRPTDAALARRLSGFVRFDEAHTPLPLTVPAHAAMLTGAYPLGLGVLNNRQSLRPPADRPALLQERLAAAGYRTGGVVATFLLGHAAGFAHGFGYWREPETPPGKEIAEQITALASDFLDREEGPVFLFAHYYDPHVPFMHPDRYTCLMRADPALDGVLARRGLEGVAYGEVLDGAPPRASTDGDVPSLARMVALYDSGVRYATDQVAELLNLWDGSRHGAGSLVVITSDHGEGLGEHGFWSHGMNMHGEALRVPLLVRWPGAAGAAGPVRDLVSLLDIVPTALEAAGLAIPGDLPGRSLREAASGRAGERPFMGQRMRYALSSRPEKRRNWRPGDGYARLDARFKYIEEEGEPPALYDRRSDPLETRNIAPRHPQRVRDFARDLRAWKERTGVAIDWPPGGPGEERRLQLRSLGYVD